MTDMLTINIKKKENTEVQEIGLNWGIKKGYLSIRNL